MSESSAPVPAPQSDTPAGIAGDAASPLTASPETAASSSTDLTTTRLGLAEQLDGQRQALLEVAEAIALHRDLGELFSLPARSWKSSPRLQYRAFALSGSVIIFRCLCSGCSER